MNQLTKNRLIGGGVLLLAGALFIPAILTPDSKPLTNPDLAINIRPSENTTVAVMPKNKPVELVSAKEGDGIVVQPLSLESLSEDVAVSAQKPSNQQTAQQATKKKPLMAISLESVDDRPSAVVQKPAAASNKEKNTPASWLRIGSFSSRKNADKLAATLKSSRYPVKIETIKVEGKAFQRVLVGPFSNEKRMTKIMKSIQKRGYNPSVQR